MNVDAKLWYEVFRRDRGYCQYCGLDLLQAFSVLVSATVDHIVARSVDGRDKLDNLVLSCPGCNQLLSRKAHLKTFVSRKAEIERIHKERSHQLEELQQELRKES